ncbi:hypothetical protein [Deinococcus misasensis]|uniref:hypothetical protein n=1 Tax=Deinococcus misasensis TaxID=392413 RepID=UPI0005532E2D|nr:hypothetical protein [Deinococcus misasensis]
MDKLQKPSLLRVQLLGGLWIVMVVVFIFSALPAGMGTGDILLASHFARMSFANTVVLSLVVAGYMVLRHTGWLRFPFAVLTVFFGAFALLPYLVIRDLMVLKDQSLKTPH